MATWRHWISLLREGRAKSTSVDLLAHQAGVAHLIPGALSVVFPLGLIVDAVSGAARWPPILLHIAIWEPIWLGAALLVRVSSRVSARAERTLVFLGMLLVAAVATSPWVYPTPLLHKVYFIIALPLAFSAICFWRPRYTIALGMTSIVGALGSEYYFTGGLSPSASTRAMVGVVFTILGVVSNTMVRGLWATTEKARSTLNAASRMQHLGQMTAGIAHELKTPIAAVDSAMTTARDLVEELEQSIGHDGVTEDDLREIAQEIGNSMTIARRATQRASTFIQSIRDHTKVALRPLRTRFFVRQQLEGILVLLNHRIKRAGVKVDLTAVAPDVQLEGDPGKLDQVLTNLIRNSLDAIEESHQGSTIRVSARASGDRVSIVVEDDGPGIPPEIRQRIFDYLFSTRTEAGGTGLGLSMCRDIVEGEFQGTIVLQTKEDNVRGTRFMVSLRDAPSFAGVTHLYEPALLEADVKTNRKSTADKN